MKKLLMYMMVVGFAVSVDMQAALPRSCQTLARSGVTRSITTGANRVGTRLLAPVMVRPGSCARVSGSAMGAAGHLGVRSFSSAANDATSKISEKQKTFDEIEREQLKEMGDALLATRNVLGALMLEQQMQQQMPYYKTIGADIGKLNYKLTKEVNKLIDRASIVARDGRNTSFHAQVYLQYNVVPVLRYIYNMNKTEFVKDNSARNNQEKQALQWDIRLFLSNYDKQQSKKK